MSEPRPTVILSSGRCGSTLLSRIAASARELLSISEVFSALHPGSFPDGRMAGAEFWHVLDAPRGRWTCLVEHRLEPSEVVYDIPDTGAHSRATGVPPLFLMTLPWLTDDVPGLYEEMRSAVHGFQIGTVGEQYGRLFSWLCQRFGKRVWVERSGASLNSVEDIVEAFPDARFVHLYRSGLDTARSMSAHSGFRLAIASERLLRWLHVDPFESSDRTRLDRVPLAWQSLLPESFDPVAFRNFPIPLEDFATFWAVMEGRGLDLLTAMPEEQVMHLRYEDLLTAPRTEVERLARFMEIDVDSTDGQRWLDDATALVRADAGVRDTDPPGGRAAFACRAGERRLAAAGLAI